MVRHVWRKFNFSLVFRSRWTPYSLLTKVKNTVPLGEQSIVAYCVPCKCVQVYTGEAKQKLEMTEEDQDT